MIVDAVQRIEQELAGGLKLSKCQKCGCMQDALHRLLLALPHIDTDSARALQDTATIWSQQMQPVKYACLGCAYCYPAMAQNIFSAGYPQLNLPAANCGLQTDNETWPPVAGEYFVLSPSAPVAVSTLASADLAEALAKRQPAGLSIVGKTETENIGIDKIIKNTTTNPALRFLLICGSDSLGHKTGQTLLALVQNGVDDRRRVIGAPGKRPVLQNVTPDEVSQFCAQIEVVDMIGCTDLNEISASISALSASPVSACGCDGGCDNPVTLANPALKIKIANPEITVKLDKAGYFVILPLARQGLINVEHYNYDNSLLRIIEGKTARSIYLNIIENGWVTELSHAAYLGKELAKAELSLRHGFKYTQDGA
ncbi:MAG: hypothetical protein FOGNACKC_05385 [Anaerolineae bacterium]|nr:hypothetical protein [Anaerolineae bacterium]